MADDGRRRGGGKALGLGVLAGAVAVAMIYLGRCVPGLGVGPSSPAPAPTATPDTAKAKSAASVRIVVDGERCAVDGGAPGPCDAACRTAAVPGMRVELDGTLGTHATVDGLRKCLSDAGVRDVLLRAE